MKDQVNKLIEVCNRALSNITVESGTIPRHRVNAELFAQLRSGALSCIYQHYGEKHPFYLEFDNFVKTPDKRDTERAKGILAAVKSDLEKQ